MTASLQFSKIIFRCVVNLTIKDYTITIMSYWDPDNFNSLYYTGPLGFIARSQHYLLEAKYNNRDFFSCTLELAATNGYHFKFVTHGFN